MKRNEITGRRRMIKRKRREKKPKSKQAAMIFILFVFLFLVRKMYAIQKRSLQQQQQQNRIENFLQKKKKRNVEQHLLNLNVNLNENARCTVWYEHIPLKYSNHTIIGNWFMSMHARAMPSVPMHKHTNEWEMVCFCSFWSRDVVDWDCATVSTSTYYYYQTTFT